LTTEEAEQALAFDPQLELLHDTLTQVLGSSVRVKLLEVYRFIEWLPNGKEKQMQWVGVILSDEFLHTRLVDLFHGLPLECAIRAVRIDAVFQQGPRVREGDHLAHNEIYGGKWSKALEYVLVRMLDNTVPVICVAGLQASSMRVGKAHKGTANKTATIVVAKDAKPLVIFFRPDDDKQTLGPKHRRMKDYDEKQEEEHKRKSMLAHEGDKAARKTHWSID
jgi:hypothetical protein